MFVRYASAESRSNKDLPEKALVYGRNDHSIDASMVDPDAVRIIEVLHGRGFEAFIVGGAVRDMMLKKRPKDFDIATDAKPSQIRRMFHNSRAIGRRFKIMHVFFGKKIFEVTTFRSISTGSIGNEFGMIEEDVMRRDFTINALYYDPILGHIVDFVGGVKDLQQRKIRPVIPLDRIFAEDPVRMVRAVKYKATTGFDFSFKLAGTIRKCVPLLSEIPASRMSEEMMKILRSSCPEKIVEDMLDYDVFEYLQQGAAKMCADSAFRKKYLASMCALRKFNESDAEDAALSKRIEFLIGDFAKIEAEKCSAKGISPDELFSQVCKECRNFVQPACLPVDAMKDAVRAVLERAGYSIPVRKRGQERWRRHPAPRREQK